MSHLQAQIRAALTAAMRARDKPAVAALRSALAALANAEAVPVESMPRAGAVESSRLGVGAADAPRHTLTADEEDAVLAAEIAEREAAITHLEAAAPERTEALRREIDVLSALADQPT